MEGGTEYKSQLSHGYGRDGKTVVVSCAKGLRCNDIGTGSVTDCLLRSFSDLKRQTELHYVG